VTDQFRRAPYNWMGTNGGRRGASFGVPRSLICMQFERRKWEEGGGGECEAKETFSGQLNG
jgi:hypothetical protein